MRAVTVSGIQIALALTVVAMGIATLCGADVMLRVFDGAALGTTPRLIFGAVETLAGLCLLAQRVAIIGAAVLISLCIALSGVIAVEAAARHEMAGQAIRVVAPGLDRTIDRACGGADQAPALRLRPSTSHDI